MKKRIIVIIVAGLAIVGGLFFVKFPVHKKGNNGSEQITNETVVKMLIMNNIQQYFANKKKETGTITKSATTGYVTTSSNQVNGNITEETTHVCAR